MARKSNNRNKAKQLPTNGWDVLKALIDGIFSLMSLNKMAAVGVFWYLLRDMIYVFNLPAGYDYENHLLNFEFLEYLINHENTIITIESALIIFLAVACISLILFNGFLRKEITRMAEVRRKAIHGKEKIDLHNTSDI